MATKYWTGRTIAVAQVSTVTVTAYDAATTYAIIIGGVTVSVVGSGGTTTTVATALTTALNASTHPYFSKITWTSNAAVITGTADTAGVPFTATTSETGGAGTIGDFSDSTACTGPNWWSKATNWSDGAVPVDTDTVYIQDSSVNICWGLDQSGIQLNGLYIRKSFTGKIGLDYANFATSADGDTVESTYPVNEYRGTYLQLDGITTNYRCLIGDEFGAGNPNGSQRINIDFSASAAVVEVADTASSSSEDGRPAVRFKFGHASSALYVKGAPGGVGIASNIPGETSTIGTVIVAGAGSRVELGAGTTVTTVQVDDGEVDIQAAATITTLRVNGGIVRTEGDFTITTVNQYGGTFYSNQIKTGGNAITTFNMYDGTVDATQSTQSRTWATWNWLRPAGVRKIDGSIVTITTDVDFAGKHSLSCGAA